MYNLVKNILRGVRKRLFQYLGISFLLIIIVATMTGLYSSSHRTQSAFYDLEAKSGAYDYRVANEKIEYKDSQKALATIKAVIAAEFSDSLPDYDEIIAQINLINIEDIEKGFLPEIPDDPGKEINEKLKTYLLNWEVNYKLIFFNYILNTDVKTSEKTKNYQITKSFFKGFSSNQEKKLFFDFQDAFYLNDSSIDNKNFDFSPQRNGINEVYLVAGRKPIKDEEIVINPTFAQKNNIALGSKIKLLPNEEGEFTVVGLGYTYWGIVPLFTFNNVNISPNNTTPVFTTREWFNHYLDKHQGEMSYLSVRFLLKISNKDPFLTFNLEEIFDNYFDFASGSLFVQQNEGLENISLKETFNMQDIVYSSISFIVLLAAVFIVLSYVKKEIELQKKQVGVLKSLGYKNSEISFGFTMLFFLLALFSTIVGFTLGFPLQLRFNVLSELGFFLPVSTVYFSIISLIFGVFVTTIVLSIASFLQSNRSLAKNLLALIYDRSSSSSSKWIAILKKPFNHWKFKPRLAISFALKSVSKLVLVFLIFIFATFLLMFQNVAIDVFSSKIDHLYSYLNKDINYYNHTASMYKFSDDGKIEAKVYDWVNEKDLDPAKALTAEDFSIDSEEKANKFIEIGKNYKGYYISGHEFTKLYRIINKNENDNGEKNEGNNKNCLEYINPKNILPEDNAEQICQFLSANFKYIKGATGINPEIQDLPAISFGQNIINKNYYPNLEFKGMSAPIWIGHDQQQLISNRFDIVSLYNNNDPDNLLAWKKWFNLIEAKGYDIDPVFNNAHNLGQEEVSYIDVDEQKKTEKAYVVPVVISKALSSLNKYKINDRALVLINVYGKFYPVIFSIKGITTTNLDTSTYYLNINDLKKVIKYVDSDDEVLENSFNNFYSKDKSSYLPLNSYNFFNPNGEYNLHEINTKIPINSIPKIVNLIKDRAEQIFSSVRTIIEISKWLTIIALAFVLIIIVNMILDNNLLIIAMMKSLGYRINEINLLIIGSYIFTLVLAFIIGSVLSYVTWDIIIWIVAKLAMTTFLLPISILTILLSFALIFAVIMIGYIVGLYFIKFKPVTSLLQSD